MEENLEIAREKMKRAYDRGKSDSGISIGDLVLLKKNNRKSKGPFQRTLSCSEEIWTEHVDQSGGKGQKDREMGAFEPV